MIMLNPNNWATGQVQLNAARCLTHCRPTPAAAGEEAEEPAAAEEAAAAEEEEMKEKVEL